MEQVFLYFFHDKRRTDPSAATINAIFPLFLMRLKHLILKYELSPRDVYHVFVEMNRDQIRVKNFLMAILLNHNNTVDVDHLFLED